MNTPSQAGGPTDLLSSILGITVRNEEKISEQDRAFCQAEQDKLYRTLEQLSVWYDLFNKQAADPRYEYLQPQWQADGSVKFREPYGIYSNSEGKYDKFEFYPFECINRIVKLTHKAYLTFSNTIIEHFKQEYSLSVPDAGIGTKMVVWGYRPNYQFLVDHVIGHLGGKSFRETAEEELISKFLEEVEPWGWDKTKPEVKGDKIIFPRGVRYGSSYDRPNKIDWGNLQKFDKFCAGIMFAATTILHGHSGLVPGFDRENVDFTKWYSLTGGDAVTMKLYKNGRVDVKFKEARFADLCFKKLRLGTLELRNY